jgi:hypothetical protein
MHETTQEALFCGKGVRRRLRQLREQPGDVPGQLRVPRNRARYQLSLSPLVRDLTADKSRIEIQNAPAAREATDRHAIVHLARVHHDYVTSLRFDLADHAP